MKQEYVVGYMITKTMKPSVLLIQKARPEWQRGRLNGIGGKIERGETPRHAMVREFLEETSLETTEEQWDLFTVVSGLNWKVYHFRNFVSHTIFSRGSNTEPVLWFPLTDRGQIDTELKLPIVEHLAWTIPMALDPDITWSMVFDHTADGMGRTQHLEHQRRLTTSCFTGIKVRQCTVCMTMEHEPGGKDLCPFTDVAHHFEEVR